MTTCTRCGNERKTVTIFKVRPGGHTWSSLTPPDFESTAPPAIERSCGDCLTDEEILREIRPIMEFGLGALLRTLGPDFPDMLVSLETARAYFQVRNNNPDGHSRRAVIRALGLGE